MTPLSSIPTGQRFQAGIGTYMKGAALAWDVLRDSKDHWLNGVNPQVDPRPDAVYVVQLTPEPGIIVLMLPDALVEPVPEPTPASEYAYRVTMRQLSIGGERVYGVQTLDEVRELIGRIGRTASGPIVAIERNGVHIGADGVPTKEQGRGLQFRSVENRTVIGSLTL